MLNVMLFIIIQFFFKKFPLLTKADYLMRNTEKNKQTVKLLNILVKNVGTFIFQDSLMNRKFKRTEFIWNRNPS